MIPRYGSHPQPDRRYTLRPGAYAVLPRDGLVLLTQELNDEREFQLPGGGIDPGEAPIHALHREVFEETGWHISRPHVIGRFRRFVFMPEYDIHAEKLCTIYAARPVLRLSDPLEPHHRAVWMRPDQAVRTLANEGDAAIIEAYLS